MVPRVTFLHDSLQDAGKDRKEIPKNKVLRTETVRNADINTTKCSTVKKEQSRAASDEQGDCEEDEHIVISDHEALLEDRANSPVELDEGEKKYTVFSMLLVQIITFLGGM